MSTLINPFDVLDILPEDAIAEYAMLHLMDHGVLGVSITDRTNESISDAKSSMDAKDLTILAINNSCVINLLRNTLNNPTMPASVRSKVIGKYINDLMKDDNPLSTEALQSFYDELKS
jgi:hypothetical protein